MVQGVLPTHREQGTASHLIEATRSLNLEFDTIVEHD